MRIISQTEQALVVEESTRWVSCVVFVPCLALVCASIVTGKTQMLYGAAVFLFASFYLWRTEAVVFDAGRRMALWNRRRFLWAATGSIPFSAITGVEVESTVGAHGSVTYRLAILTAHGATPMSDSFGDPLSRYEWIREAILAFVKLKGGNSN